MAEIIKAMFKLDEERMKTSDPAKLAELDVEEEYLRGEYRRIMGVE